jgi:phosphatidylserine/phosphatidylglycerophosphate/cardiolipin synthase-like enzyme
MGEKGGQVARDLLKLIDSADLENVLISACLIPTPQIEAAIERVESRGVQVRIFTNSLRSNNRAAAHASYCRHKQLNDRECDPHDLRSESKDRSRHVQGNVSDRSLALHTKALITCRKR